VKHQTVLILVALVLQTQLVSANPRGKSETSRSTVEGARITKDTAAEAARRTSVGANDPAVIVSALGTSKIGNLSPSEKRNLTTVITTNAVAREAVQEIMLQSSDPQLTELNTERLQAISNLKDIPADATGAALAAMSFVARAEQAYATLALEAGSKAASWAPDIRSNFSFLLNSANALVTQGKSRGEALIEAAKELEKSRGVRLDIDKIKEFCR
jgi:hypothetical protein